MKFSGSITTKVGELTETITFQMEFESKDDSISNEIDVSADTMIGLLKRIAEANAPKKEVDPVEQYKKAIDDYITGVCFNLGIPKRVFLGQSSKEWLEADNKMVAENREKLRSNLKTTDQMRAEFEAQIKPKEHTFSRGLTCDRCGMSIREDIVRKEKGTNVGCGEINLLHKEEDEHRAKKAAEYDAQAKRPNKDTWAVYPHVRFNPPNEKGLDECLGYYVAAFDSSNTLFISRMFFTEHLPSYTLEGLFNLAKNHANLLNETGVTIEQSKRFNAGIKA